MVQDQRSRGEHRATGAAGASCGGGRSGQAAAGDHFGLWMAWKNGGFTMKNVDVHGKMVVVLRETGWFNLISARKIVFFRESMEKEW